MDGAQDDQVRPPREGPLVRRSCSEPRREGLALNNLGSALNRRGRLDESGRSRGRRGAIDDQHRVRGTKLVDRKAAQVITHRIGGGQRPPHGFRLSSRTVHDHAAAVLAPAGTPTSPSSRHRHGSTDIVIPICRNSVIIVNLTFSQEVR